MARGEYQRGRAFSPGRYHPHVRPARSRRLDGFGTTIFTEMTRLAQLHGAINLSQGFPDFDGPDLAKDAAIAAIRDGHGQYARMSGAAELHAALSEKYRRDWGLEYAVDSELTVTSGATEAIFAAIQGVCDPGDEVVLFEPYYDSYKASVVMAGAVPRVVALRGPDWTLDRDEVRAAFTRATRAILLNTPHNPTGKVFSPDELAFLAGLCRERDVLCITDEVYEHLVYEGRHTPMATLPGMRERTIAIDSMSKTYSVTGWRVGWVIAPPDLTVGVRRVHDFLTVGAAAPLQTASIAGLLMPDGYYDRLLADYRERRDVLVPALEAAGFRVHRPDGAYYVMTDIRDLTDEDDVAFARRLIADPGVATVPGSSFFSRQELGRTKLRFAFPKRLETLRAAAERLATLAPARV